MTSSADVSPTTTPCGTPLSGAPKYGTVIPNRIFVGGIAANTTEAELKQFFSAYGAVKDSKIIADRAGVSKGYGFITFENQEDADRIIKKESDNLVFRDRKLNIGPAIRKQQVLPRAFESPVSPGTILFSNGVPYTYQNGMAVFASPEGSYTVPQAQVWDNLVSGNEASGHFSDIERLYYGIRSKPQQAMMVPAQTPPMYMQPQYATYSVPALTYASASSYQQTSPQWATAAAAAAGAATGQWRYITQSPTQAMTAAANPYMMAMQPELMYAQLPPQAYQPTELTDAALMDGTSVEGSILPVEQGVTEVLPGMQAAVSRSLGLSLQHQQQQQQTATVVDTLKPCSPATINTCADFSSALNVASTSKLPSISSIQVAPYKKPLTSLARRTYSSPTFIVRNGHKVQCLMMPQKAVAPSSDYYLSRAEDGLTSMPSGLRYTNPAYTSPAFNYENYTNPAFNYEN